MTMVLNTPAYTVNHKRVARVMSVAGMQAKIRRANPYKQIMQKTHEHAVCPNLLDRQFTQTVPEQVGGTDITYLWMPHLRRFGYLSIVKDFASGEILAHHLATTLTMPIALRTIDLLVARLGMHTAGFMLHSDQGVHYTHPQYRHKLKQLSVVQSMSRRGNCIDNAATETFFGHLKDELDLSNCSTFHAVEIAVATYVSYYNETRKQWHRKKMAPIEYRNHLLTA